MLRAAWAHLDSNQGPTGYEPAALPTELWALPSALGLTHCPTALSQNLGNEG